MQIVERFTEFQFPSNGKADLKFVGAFAPDTVAMFQFPSNGKADLKYRQAGMQINPQW